MTDGQEPESDVADARSTDWRERFPELYNLFGAHLVQSWRTLHETPSEALGEGIDGRDIDELRAALGELHDLVALQLSDRELRDVLFYELGSYYIPSDRTCADWLEEVAAQLATAVTLRDKSRESGSPDAS